MSGSCIAILNSKMKLSHKVHKLKSSAADEINIISIDSSQKSPRKMLWSKKETKCSLDNACCKQSCILPSRNVKARESCQFHFQWNFDVLQSSVWNNLVKNSG